MKTKGFATLGAVGLLVLTAAFLAGAVLVSQQILLEQTHSQSLVDQHSQAWATVGVLFQSLQKSWNADQQTLDQWWQDHASTFPQGTLLVSLSARINLNSMTPFLLQNSELSATLLGKSVEDFTNNRINKGPFALVSDYRDYFQPQALNQLYTTYSVFSVNSADEIMLEKILALRTGSEGYASTIRAALRQFRTNKQLLVQSDWDTLVGAEKDTLGDLVGVDGELDVNTAPLALLQALFRDADFKVEQPDAKVQTILSGRTSRPWTPATLMAALGLVKNAPILAYLGTRSRMIQASVSQGPTILTLVALVSYSTDSPPRLTIRVLDTQWTAL